MFYVSLKGDRDSVFLREAYRDSQLIDKDRLLVIKEKFRALVSVPRFPKRGAPQKDDHYSDRTDEPEEGSGEDGEDWSIDDYMTDGQFDDVDDGNEDDWSDEDDDMPPDFDEDYGTVKIGENKSAKLVDSSVKKKEKVLAPVFPDGRPRERW